MRCPLPEELFTSRVVRRNEDGSMVIFTFFIMAMMLIVGGMAVDMMRFENYRSRLQAALDRSVLAAADLDICLDPDTNPRDVVEDYIAKAGFDAQLDDVTVTSGLSDCTITAAASIEVNTIFMQMVGVDQISTPTAATATEAASAIEISLVLDSSGSMGWEGRIEALRPAAQAFVTSVMDGYPEGDVSISMVPYSSNISLTPELAATLNLNYAHDYSYCIDPPANPNFFTSTEFDMAASYDQTPHVDPYHWTNTPGNWDGNRFICDIRPTNVLIPWAGTADELTGPIGLLQPYQNTSIDFAAKWGVSLLDPTMRPAVDALIAGGQVDAGMSGRPYDYTQTGVIKVMVLMTDGMNTDYHHFNDQFPRGISDVYYNPITDDWLVPDEGETDDLWPTAGDFVDPMTGNVIDISTLPMAYLGDFNQLTWNEVFDAVSFDDHAWYFRAGESANTTYYDWTTALYHRNTTAEKDTDLDAICTAAKDEGIVFR